MNTIFVPLLLGVVSTQSIAGTLYKVSKNELPYANEVVNQKKFKEMPSYPEPGSSPSWWLCGHAAFATAINVLRTTPANHASQLEWFHTQLLNQGTWYRDKVKNPHRMAYGDDIAAIMNKNSTFSAKKETTTERGIIKDKLIKALTSPKKQQVVALTKLHGWGHFVVVHEIYSDPSGAGGGYVKFADPYGGIASSRVGYTEFLNGMDSAGTKGRHSFWIVAKK
jgi:hypothetical protein